MQEEIWKDIQGYEGIYQVSSLGRVKSLPRENRYFNSLAGKECVRHYKERIMKLKKNRGGYMTAHLRDEENGKEDWPTVHRLVATAFIPNPNEKPTINHKDGIKVNNFLENLEWATWSENTRHAHDNGLAKSVIAKYAKKGSDHPQSKLKESDILDIRKKRQEGMTLASIASEYGVYFSLIHKICTGEAWKHV